MKECSCVSISSKKSFHLKRCSCILADILLRVEIFFVLISYQKNSFNVNNFSS